MIIPDHLLVRHILFKRTNNLYNTIPGTEDWSNLFISVNYSDTANLTIIDFVNCCTWCTVDIKISQ